MALRNIACVSASYRLDLILITEYQSFTIKSQPSIIAPYQKKICATLLLPMPTSLLRIVVNKPALYIISRDFLVRVTGLEPVRVQYSLDFKSKVSTYSTTPAYKWRIGDRTPLLDSFIAR